MASNQGIDLRQFEASFLSAHNKYRKLHGSPPLKLNRNLCSSAQKWADHLLSIRALQHSNSGLGENIYYKSSSNPQDLPGNEGVDSWYREVQKYNFSKPGFSSATGHFTQVVWKDSKEVGYGVATDAKRVYYLVAQYSPAGNITNPGYFQRNVLPAGTAGSR
ncbi:Golgi-associated plant pathogenesis-related protein 1-like isoform X1 [Lithobates pipiens]